MNPKASQARCDFIRQIGCLACRRFGWYSAPDVHHLNLGGHAGQVRRGDECTIGLCPYHHRGVPPEQFPPDQVRDLLGPSLAKDPRAFREMFGSDDALLQWENELIQRAPRVGRRA